MSDDAVVLRNYEGMLIRYQAEDKPATIKPTATRGNERLKRRRLSLHTIPAPVERADSCCGDGHIDESELEELVVR